MLALPDHDGTLAADHDGAILLVAAGADGDDPLGWVGSGLSDVEHLTFRVQGVAGKERVRHTHLVPAQCEAVLTDVFHAHPGRNSEGQRAVDKAPAEGSARAVVVVEVNLVGVVGQQGEGDVVALRHRPPVAAAVYVADGEVLEETSSPGDRLAHCAGCRVTRTSRESLT